MLEKPVVQGQYARWLTVLSTYDFSIEHHPGNRHSNADGLSRIPCRQCGRDNMCEVAHKVENNILASNDGPSTCAITRAGAHRDPALVSKHQQRQQIIDNWSPEEIINSQQNDPEIRPILDALE